MAVLSRFALCVVVTTPGVAAFAQTDPAVTVHPSAEEGGPRRWEVIDEDTQIRGAPVSDSEVLVVLEIGAILSNLGCSDQADQIWCEVQPLPRGPFGYAPVVGLQPAVGPDGVVPMGPDDSARRARTRDFDANGTISCAQERGQDMGTCRADVARGDGGDATVVVTFANGFARTLSFVHGKFVRASATMSGVGTDIEWRQKKGVHVIRADDQRFELPNALVYGN